MTLDAFKVYFDPLFADYLRAKMDEAILSTAEVLTLGPIAQYALDFAEKGDRLRPYVAYLAFNCAGGKDVTKILTTLFAIELSRLFAAVHDDIVDDSPLRGGMQAMHERFSKSHAVLFGDLCFSFAAQAVMDADIPADAKCLFFKMNRDTVIGQMHDVSLVSKHYSTVTADMLDRVIEMKSARATFCYPVAIGLSVAGKPYAALLSRCCGAKLGHALQRLDDLHDVILSQDELGSVRCRDIMHGTHTHLSRHVHSYALPEEQVIFEKYFGKKAAPEGIEKIVRVCHASGAVAAEKQCIARILDEADKLSLELADEPQMKKMWQSISSILRNQLYSLS